MNEKEKAEAYVRSKCPELMELSFGCHVYTGRFSAEQVVLDNDGKELMVRSTVNGIIQDYKFKEMHNLKIIGHPIQLQHWLRVLGEVCDKEYTYILEGPELSAWHEATETVAFVFNLTTGQPATEADYQAFNQIVGI